MENIRTFMKAASFELSDILNRADIIKTLNLPEYALSERGIDLFHLYNIYFDKIANKLLLFDKDNKEAYAKMLSRVMAIELEVFIDSYRCSNCKYLDDTWANVEMFISSIIGAFNDCNIDITSYLKMNNKTGIEWDDYIDVPWEVKYDIEQKKNRIQAKANLQQQWTFIRHLIEHTTGWRLTDDNNRLIYHKTDISAFMSFVCGGSTEYIRKHLEKEISNKDATELCKHLDNLGLNIISNRIKNDIN